MNNYNRQTKVVPEKLSLVILKSSKNKKMLGFIR